MTHSPAARPREARRRLGFVLVAAATAAMMAGASAPSPFYPTLQEQLHLLPVATTGIFAVYAVALLAALLVFGSLSDHLGRRPVISGAFILLAGSVTAFLLADSLAMLLVARVLQGIASGLLLTTLSAAIADLEAEDDPGSSAAWNTVAPLGGLALGALASGLLLDLMAEPRTLVFVSLSVLYIAFAALVWAAPETSPRAPGLAASLKPHLTLPPAARSGFVSGAPAVFAGWATGGLYLSLGAAIVHTTFGIQEHLWQGMVITILAGVGAAAAAVLHRFGARTITIFGTTALALGTALSLLAIGLGSFGLFLAAVVVAGAGFGTAFMGVIRSISPLVEDHERAGTFASLFVVAYTAFGVPAVLAGLLAPVLSLPVTTYAYGGLVTVLATVAAISRARSKDVEQSGEATDGTDGDAPHQAERIGAGAASDAGH
ncbi:MFS transporter [Pseudarthrobacter sp. SL88]|uniref:MFS transporter n=1 Tax=Pseudarthrobacter sp. SL88 TaxID=2994666 RepID=UPI00227411C5|nr:MFS transporter [Pseudarthrobacter sp. SL88]MCY1673192.1 MFS transporter [Pseudarthrobacter sp. SL88]